jgi:hypothetical protein
MVPSKPDIGYILRVLSSLFRSLLAPNAYLILNKTLLDVVLIEKDDPRSKEIGTLAMDGAERLYINLEFWRKYARRDIDVKILLLHELLHHILGDTELLRREEKNRKEGRINSDPLINVAQDARINAYITDLLGLSRDTSNVLTTLYKPDGKTGLLRPFSTYSTKDKLCNLYGFIYNDYTGPKEFKEILAALKILLNQKVIRMKFIGSHGTSLKGMPGEVAGSLARDIAEGLESKEGGYFNSIRASFIKQRCGLSRESQGSPYQPLLARWTY